MKKLPGRFINAYFAPALDLRVRLFNVLASFGTLVSVLSAVVSFFLGDRLIEYAPYLLFALLSFALMVYGTKTGRY